MPKTWPRPGSNSGRLSGRTSAAKTRRKRSAIACSSNSANATTRSWGCTTRPSPSPQSRISSRARSSVRLTRPISASKAPLSKIMRILASAKSGRSARKRGRSSTSGASCVSRSEVRATRARSSTLRRCITRVAPTLAIPVAVML